ncbi:MAG: hypothetical protein Q9183_006933 [Haloplaca sp. 2 TL-2023]
MEEEEEDAEDTLYADRIASAGEPFTTKIFSVIVGPNNTTFNVHESFLHKSPVFARMCAGYFKESQTGTIELPEESPIIFGIFLEYLYKGTFFSNPYVYEEAYRSRTAMNLAHLYLMADEYGILELKPIIVSKLSTCYISPQADTWLPVAETICASIPASDDVYPHHLRTLVKGYRAAWNMKADKMKIFEEPVEKGGRLALEISRACWS